MEILTINDFVRVVGKEVDHDPVGEFEMSLIYSPPKEYLLLNIHHEITFLEDVRRFINHIGILGKLRIGMNCDDSWIHDVKIRVEDYHRLLNLVAEYIETWLVERTIATWEVEQTYLGRS